VAAAPLVLLTVEGDVLRLNIRSGQIEAVLGIGHFLEDADAVGDLVFVAVR